MATATLSLIGLYNYDDTIFDKLTFPEGIDKTVAVNNILFRSGDFEVLFPDPDFMRDAIGLWGYKWQRTFERWVKALSVDYEPLYNYDRTEEWLTDEDITDHGAHEQQMSGTSTDTSESSGENTDTDTVSAYNSSTFENDKQRNSTYSADSSGNSQSSNQSSGTDDNKRDRTEKRKGRAYGNIGVTTSQQMLQSELDVAAWNLYEHIADIFLNEFIIPVY